MNIETLQDYCLSKKGTTADFPFDKHTLVFKVMGKMFALIGLEKWENGDRFVNLKCDPEYALELRDEYPDDITGAYHMSKTQWNSVYITGTVPTKTILHLIDHSYEQVVLKFTKKLKAELDAL